MTESATMKCYECMTETFNAAVKQGFPTAPEELLRRSGDAVTAAWHGRPLCLIHFVRYAADNDQIFSTNKKALALFGLEEGR